MTGKAFAVGGDEAGFARGRGKTPLRASVARTAAKAVTECGARDKRPKREVPGYDSEGRGQKREGRRTI